MWEKVTLSQGHRQGFCHLVCRWRWRGSPRWPTSPRPFQPFGSTTGPRVSYLIQRQHSTCLAHFQNCLSDSGKFWRHFLHNSTQHTNTENRFYDFCSNSSSSYLCCGGDCVRQLRPVSYEVPEITIYMFLFLNKQKSTKLSMLITCSFTLFQDQPTNNGGILLWVFKEKVTFLLIINLKNFILNFKYELNDILLHKMKKMHADRTWLGEIEFLDFNFCFCIENAG